MDARKEEVKELTVITEKIAKLPKWAQEHIKDLNRQRAVAVRALDKFVDSNTESCIYAEELVCIKDGGPSRKRNYIQSHRVTIQRGGVTLEILLPTSREGIELSWDSIRHRSEPIGIIPVSYNSMRLPDLKPKT